MQKWVKVESMLSGGVLSSVKELKKILERHCSYVKGLAGSGGVAFEICLLPSRPLKTVRSRNRAVGIS